MLGSGSKGITMRTNFFVLGRTRSQRDLLNALISLGFEKDISHISVTELCRRSSINRTTFYKHYESIFHFISCITNEFLDDMTKALDSENPYADLISCDQPERIFWDMAEYMSGGNADFLRLMLSKHGSSSFEDQLKNIWVRQIERAFKPYEDATKEPICLDSFASCFASAILGHLTYHLQTKTENNHDLIAHEMRVLFYDGMITSLAKHPVVQPSSALSCC